MIELINTSLLFPHPQNPRKDVGDVSELADSIKANGVYQNLTVIKGGAGVPSGQDGYTVIIGHRRLAASKLAGIEDLPCSVVEIDEKQQVATMLLENMQRTDLTIYEQAQGFQMMLDLGETQDTISEKTGFSKSTIRHRIKLLELDQEQFKKSQERVVSMADYIELEKIKDPNLKNEALKEIGTNNFKWKVNNLVEREKRVNDKKRYTDFFLEIGIEELGEDKNWFEREELFSRNISVPFSIEDKNKIKELLDKHKEIYYYYNGYGGIYIVGKVKVASKKSKKEIKRDEIKNAIEQLETQAKKSRKNFVTNYTGKKEHLSILLKEFCRKLTNSGYIREYEISKLLSIEKSNDKCMFDTEEFLRITKYQPQRIILVYLYIMLDRSFSFHNYDGIYSENGEASGWYEILEYCGYAISNEERQLINGTHKLFLEAEKLEENKNV